MSVHSPVDASKTDTDLSFSSLQLYLCDPLLAAVASPAPSCLLSFPTPGHTLARNGLSLLNLKASKNNKMKPKRLTSMKDFCRSSLCLPVIPSLLDGQTPATVVPFCALNCTKFSPAPGPLHLIFPGLEFTSSSY